MLRMTRQVRRLRRVKAASGSVRSVRGLAWGVRAIALITVALSLPFTAPRCPPDDHPAPTAFPTLWPSACAFPTNTHPPGSSIWLFRSSLAPCRVRTCERASHFPARSLSPCPLLITLPTPHHPPRPSSTHGSSRLHNETVVRIKICSENDAGHVVQRRRGCAVRKVDLESSARALHDDMTTWGRNM